MAVVISGVTITSLIAGLTTATSAATSHRQHVSTDIVLRNLAEATKRAVAGCAVGEDFIADFIPPDGFDATGGEGPCPDTDVAEALTLTVVGPQDITKSVEIRVRTP